MPGMRLVHLTLISLIDFELRKQRRERRFTVKQELLLSFIEPS